MNAPPARSYGRWAADPAIEDYALRFTPHAARRWPAGRVATTALGAASFLACEAIGASLCLAYGFANAAAAILAASVIMFGIGLPIARAAARAGLDIDLLTRGAGFGYLGSTITSLVYASFTFLLFAIEASIMSGGIALITGLPLWVAHILSVVAVVPVAIMGMRAISRFQAWTQPLWLVLQAAPFVGLWLLVDDPAALAAFPGRAGDSAIGLLPFGLALSTLLALLPQIGEQADYLRFLPVAGRRRWWAALIAGGPGWVVIGAAKLLLGAALAVFALDHGLDPARAAVPAEMLAVIFGAMTGSIGLALLLTGLLVVVAQLKINVANAYAGSIAWSNFFARLTHAHPGRVVWLVFNAGLALLLMETGVFAVIERILMAYAILAAGWIGALAGNLMVAVPLGLAPADIEFRRAHLYDINPVGVGAMGLALIVAVAAMMGVLGPLAQAFAPVLGLVTAFVAAPAIARATGGRFYLARPATLPPGDGDLGCKRCGGRFERADMATCPFIGGTICSLCCTLEAQCRDRCKIGASVGEQGLALANAVLPARLAKRLDSNFGRFLAVMALFSATNALILSFIAVQYAGSAPESREIIETTLLLVFLALTIVAGIAAWLLVLAHASRRDAETAIDQRTAQLLDEIAAHARTETALNKARDVALAANQAKTRYLIGVSHEIRSPLNAIHGYAQLLERGSALAPQDAGGIIRRSSEHLADLIDGLQDISRIESGVLKLAVGTVPLRALLDGIAEMFRVQADDKGLAFAYSADPRLPEFVRTDEKRLRQLLINLLSNAIKYTPAGEVRLAVRYSGLVARFEVTDTGIGIAPEDLDRIFAPFDRGGSPAALAQPGTGLGLALCRMLAQILGGDIAVTSTPGQGSRFVLKMMLAAPGEAPAETSRRRPVTGYEGPRRTILAIDDDPAQLAILQALLRPLGFNLYVAGGGPAGLALARHCRPDLVLLDIQMPGMTGWDVAHRLRDEFGPALRLLMVSGNAHEFAPGRRGDGEHDAVHDGFVLKPVEQGQLLDGIAAQLGLSWTDQAAPAAAPRPAGALPLVAGAAPYLAELRRLGRIGHVRGIDAKLAELEAAVPGSDALVAQLRAPVRAFDLKAFLKLLDTTDA